MTEKRHHFTWQLDMKEPGNWFVTNIDTEPFLVVTLLCTTAQCVVSDGRYALYVRKHDTDPLMVGVCTCTYECTQNSHILLFLSFLST